LGISRTRLLQRRGHIGPPVFAANVGGEIIGLHCAGGCGACSGLSQTDAELGKGAAVCFPANGGDRRIAFAARRKTLLNALLTGGRKLLKTLRGLLRGAALTARFGITVTLVGAGLFGLIGGLAGAFGFRQRVARAFIGFGGFLKRRQTGKGFVDVLPSPIFSGLPSLA
jgi:hypothetical protein